MSQDMPEYVYALFDFVPENPDELHFKVGDRIEVVEKDDVYSDGWWQVSPIRSGRPFRSMWGVCLARAASFADANARGKGVL